MHVKKLIFLASFVLSLGLVGSASAAALYSDSFDRPDSNTLGTNDNALGGTISAPWGEVEGAATAIQISGNAFSAQAGGNGYIDHKFTSAELGASFTIEFDVMPAARSNEWFNLQFGPEPASFTTGIDVNSGRVPFGFLFRAQNSWRIWDSAVLQGVNNTNIIDNSTDPARVKLEFDSPDGYSDGNTATLRVWINDVSVESLLPGIGDSYDFEWDNHTDGLYISFESNGTLQKLVDNVVISSPFVSLTQAIEPSPAEEATDIPRDVVLNWSPGTFANAHDVFFGTSLEDVNNATATVDPAGVYQGRQDGSSYAGERLDFGQTYYWRVDEVNAAPDFTVFKGAVWNFTAEPLSIPITSITATASASFGDSVPENTVNGSGLTDDLHGTVAPDMWISTGIPATIEYAFDRVYKLHELWIWNSNQTIEAFIGFGAKDIVLEHSLDGENWTVLEGFGPLAPGPGTEGYAHNNTIAFNGATAQHVRITVNTVQGFAPQASLSEVRFFFIPTLATRPSPNSGTTGVAPDLTLSWGRNGREADRHEIYVGSDLSDLPLAGSVTESSFDTLALDLQLSQTYYWQVVEVNDTMDPGEWAGAIWNFTTAESIVVDGMESYKDEEFLEIWATWIDGFEDPANNGALVGANPALGDFSPETGIVRSGSQSLPIHYDNSAAAQSEATRTFETSQDWTPHGVQSLVLYFQGSGTNTGGTFYVKINDTKVVYDGDTASLTRGAWNKWVILLGDVPGVNLSGVRSLTIGVEGGGAGVVYVDDITLTPVGQRDLVTPTEPGGGLVLHLPFDGDYQDVSGNGRHGTPMGGFNPSFEAGQMGQAVSFDGIDQYVEITGYQGILAVDAVQQPFSIVNWVKTTSAAGNTEMVTWGLQGAATRVTWRVHQGRLRTEHADGNLRGNTYINDGEWHHVALTVMEGAILRPEMTQLYVDGREDSYFSGADVAYIIAAGSDVNVGRSGPQNGRYFIGSIDEVRIYDRHLGAAEVAWLAGRTAPFDQ